MTMKTLPREPWRGGQICGYQTKVGGWSEGPAAYCGEYKKPGSYVCDEHDRELREDNYGVLPKFAEGNALGQDGPYFLLWEPHEGKIPDVPTSEELAAYAAQFKENAS